MKMVYSRWNDFRLLNRIAKGDTLVVKAYGWDKKPFFKQEVSGLHTIKEAIGLVRANNSAEIVWVSVYNKTTDYKAVYAVFKNTFKRTIILDLED